jgi:hypothetical protein
MDNEVLERLIKVPGLLKQFNQALQSISLPAYWEGDETDPLKFNTDYRTTPSPRFVFGFRNWKPTFTLQQLYVIYLPQQDELTWDVRKPNTVTVRKLTEEEKARL